MGGPELLPHSPIGPEIHSRGVRSPRSHFDQQLQHLQDELLILASVVDKAIDHAVESLKQRDRAASERVIRDDLTINEKRFEIEERALMLLATQQPMARDLRIIASVIHIVTDLERMGDHAEGIARISLLHVDQPLLKPLIDVPRMPQFCRVARWTPSS